MTLAQEYVNSNNYLWNSGTFLFKQSIMMKELQTNATDILEAVQHTLNSAKYTYENNYDMVQLNP